MNVRTSAAISPLMDHATDAQLRLRFRVAWLRGGSILDFGVSRRRKSIKRNIEVSIRKLVLPDRIELSTSPLPMEDLTF
jgi:hypothetical protein